MLFDGTCRPIGRPTIPEVQNEGQAFVGDSVFFGFECESYQ